MPYCLILLCRLRRVFRSSIFALIELALKAAAPWVRGLYIYIILNILNNITYLHYIKNSR